MDALALTILILGLIALSIPILMVIATWKIFEKASEPGWQALIPFYNAYILYKIAWKTQYFFLFLGCIGTILIVTFIDFLSVFLFPLVLIAYAVIFFLKIILAHKLSTAFGHEIGFTLGLFFLEFIFLMILGFGSSEYEGPQ
ncbi:MAG: hypothetical protein HFG56_04805 [Lachnospiraceae bacterium]|nr:hypothetical protein [Lachnospiraceae bacterium]